MLLRIAQKPQIQQMRQEVLCMLAYQTIKQIHSNYKKEYKMKNNKLYNQDIKLLNKIIKQQDLNKALAKQKPHLKKNSRAQIKTNNLGKRLRL